MQAPLFIPTPPRTCGSGFYPRKEHREVSEPPRRPLRGQSPLPHEDSCGYRGGASLWEILWFRASLGGTPDPSVGAGLPASFRASRARRQASSHSLKAHIGACSDTVGSKWWCEQRDGVAALTKAAANKTAAQGCGFLWARQHGPTPDNQGWHRQPHATGCRSRCRHRYYPDTTPHLWERVLPAKRTPRSI